MHEDLVGTSRAPYTLKQIKLAFRKTVRATLLDYDLKITSRDISKEDLKLFSEHEPQGAYYFLEEFCPLGQLNDEKLNEFVHQNIERFSFYKSDVV
jgi:hypothetical protein